MWSPLNGHLQLIRYILTKHFLIKKPPLFSFYGVPLVFVCFSKKAKKKFWKAPPSIKVIMPCGCKISTQWSCHASAKKPYFRNDGGQM